jgi:hypothetical protein
LIGLRIQRSLRFDESLLFRPELPERPLPLDRSPLELPLLREEPSSRTPPRCRFESDRLREDPPLPRDELPDPDDLFD